MGIEILPPSEGGIPTGITASRPSNPETGNVFYNGTKGILEIWNGSSWIACSAPAAQPTISVSDVGTNVAYGLAQGLVTITPGTDGGIASGYTVNSTVGGYTATSSSSPITITTANNGAYTFTAVSYNAFGTSPASPSSTATLTTVPQAPTIGSATASNSSSDIDVAWTLNSNGGKTISSITITPYLNGVTAQSPTTINSSSATSGTISGLTQGSSYTFKVKVTNANGDSLESDATNSVSVPVYATVDYVVVGGGGGGGGAHTVFVGGGGGGAGGFRTSAGSSGGGSNAESSLLIRAGESFGITVGAGGPDANNGAQGSSSVFSNITSLGGGRGGGQLTANASQGGSGGGGCYSQGTSGNGASGTAGQGFQGGKASNNGNNNGGGGGGAGDAGNGASSASGGNGGNGVTTNISGSAVTYAGGGGGYGGGSGGSGGGANAENAASANTGGGGGGGGGGNGRAGGSGRVIIRYPSTLSISVGGGLTANTNTVGNNKVTFFNAGSGNASLS